MTATITSFPTSRCWAGAATPTFSGWFVYLKFHEGLTPPLALRVPPPFAMCLFFVVVYYSVWLFSLFSLGGDQSVQGAMLIWPRVVCGSTTYRLAHLVVCFSRAGRSWHLGA
jgi:hypothetical protein